MTSTYGSEGQGFESLRARTVRPTETGDSKFELPDRRGWRAGHDHTEARDRRRDGHPSAGRAVPGANPGGIDPPTGKQLILTGSAALKPTRSGCATASAARSKTTPRYGPTSRCRVLPAEWPARQVEPSTRASYALADRQVHPARAGHARPAPVRAAYSERRTCRRHRAGKPFIEHRTLRRHERDDRCAVH